MARILGIDLPRNKIMAIALKSIYGVGPYVASQVLKKANIDENMKSDQLQEDHIQRIRKALEGYKVEGDLRREIGLNIKRLKDLNCYRGVRHKKGLPVRGQRTGTNARTRKGPAVAIAGKNLLSN